uniref:Major facilitator superfamily (MFS) profile domain-containing protein n=1 Tax=Acrobeloides nanus TaxID=290746 RepID=A0A914DFN4_9BILA
MSHGMNDSESSADSTAPLDFHRRPGEYKTVEEVLEKIGYWNPKVLYIVCSMALIWGLTAMPIMCSAFMNTGIACPTNETSCLEEKEKMHSITDEFHLTGNDAEWTLSIFFVANIFGGTILSYFADVIGRKPIVISSLFFMGLFGIASAFVNSFGLFLTARFMQGFFFTSSSMVNWVLACESISLKAHAHASMLFGLCWVLGYCMVAVIAYFLPDWRYIMLGVSIPSCVFGIIFWFTIPESFHFLVERRKKHKAEKWIKNMERDSNPVDCDIDLLFMEVHKDDPLHERKKNFDKAIKFLAENKIYIVYLLVSTVMWILDFMIYNGMSLFSTALVGDPYINYVLSGIVEIPAYVLAPELLNRIGRKRTVIWSHIFTAVCLLILLFVSQEHKALYVAIWLAGKLGTSTCFMCLFVYGSEIFPTPVRNTCMGLCAMLSNLGAVIAPHVKHMDAIYPGAPMLTFGLASLICGFLTTIFPETRHGSISYHAH